MGYCVLFWFWIVNENEIITHLIWAIRYVWIRVQDPTYTCIVISSTEVEQKLQINEDSMSKDKNLESGEEEVIFQEEMRRVAKTVILAMRSTADLFASVIQEELQVAWGSVK